jgi:AraC-like DNA-binding protein
MGALERISTSGLKPRRRVEFWNELCSQYSPLATQPADLATFEPSCARTVVGELPISEFNSSPARIEHTSAHVARTRHALYFFHLQLTGTGLYRQGGRESRLQQGDFTLLYSLRPYQMVFEEPNRALVLALPEDLMQREIPCPQELVAVRMGREDSLVRMVSQCATGLWQECLGGGVEGVGASLSSALLHLISCAYARLPQLSSRGSTSLENRRFQIMQYIESQLHDSALSPVTIAARFKQSPRSLHMLFSQQSETLSRYILRRRLEESARALVSPLHQGRTVSEIAFDHGFSSSAHFCKVFREHFETTPTEYRQRPARPAEGGVLPPDAPKRKAKLDPGAARQAS